MDKAKVFWSGRSQAVRLPKEFRFNSDEVRIRRQGNAVILEPLSNDWEWLDKITDNLVGNLDEDFMRFAAEKPEPQQRPELDELFE